MAQAVRVHPQEEIELGRAHLHGAVQVAPLEPAAEHQAVFSFEGGVCAFEGPVEALILSLQFLSLILSLRWYICEAVVGYAAEAELVGRTARLRRKVLP